MPRRLFLFLLCSLYECNRNNKLRLDGQGCCCTVATEPQDKRTAARSKHTEITEDTQCVQSILPNYHHLHTISRPTAQHAAPQQAPGWPLALGRRCRCSQSVRLPPAHPAGSSTLLNHSAGGPTLAWHCQQQQQ